MATRAPAPTRPETYQALLDLGWRWASIDGGTPHLVPPHGDLALCLRPVERTRRSVVTTGIAQGGCRTCKAKAGLA